MVADEARAWVNSMPEEYERGLAATVFRPFAVDLSRRLAARSPRAVLEVAAGTGVLTHEVVTALPTAEVTATDLNPAMVEYGRQRVPSATWRAADALSLPFEDGSFDAVVCQFGVMFFPDKRSAFAEARRVLEGEGRLLFNAWSTLASHDFEAAVMAGVRQAFPDDPPTFLESIPHGYAHLDVVVADVEAAGLRCLTAESVTVEGTAPAAADIAAGYCLGTPLRAGIEARGDLAAATAVVAREIERRFGPGPVTGRMTAHVVEAAPAGAERREQ